MGLTGFSIKVKRSTEQPLNHLAGKSIESRFSV
jgi:hypothetical protein